MYPVLGSIGAAEFYSNCNVQYYIDSFDVGIKIQVLVQDDANVFHLIC